MPRTILIADDVEVNRAILRMILCDTYNVVEATNGKEALEYLGDTKLTISAVLLDIVMPVMDGYQVLEVIHSTPALEQIPVIVTTAESEAEAEKRALVLGANDFIVKPYNADVIKCRLNNLIKLCETSAMVNTLRRDKLTGLWNRETFFEKAAEQIVQMPAGYYTLECIDIDNFKVINDRYGTETGDTVLKSLANILLNCFSGVGCQCGRISADNFIVIYPTENGSIFEETIVFPGVEMPVTVSVGRYVIDDTTLSVSAMYDRANLAQVSVKGRYDKHVAVYSEGMRSRLLCEQSVVNEMNSALANGQFEVWYQPQYNHLTGALIGAEALVRWNHPRRGLVFPGEFIPVFERNGFIYELDKFVWEQSCAFLRRCIDDAVLTLPVSVNISRYDLFRDELVNVLMGLIDKYGIPVDMLRLEITESAFATSTERVIDVARELISCGFTVEIDDFGSGYSSFNTLKDVPAQVLKLDMRFLEGNANSDRGGNILESIVRMSKWLGMSIIAEGVEFMTQADYLRSIGCYYVQGYLYAKPMRESDYVSLIGKVGNEEKLLTLETVENLDNNSFWNPESMDTLIFNSYVGGACIFEWHNRKIEILRANEKYSKVIGGDDCTLDAAVSIEFEKYMDAAELERLYSAIDKAVESADDVVFEGVYHNFMGKKKDTWLRTTLRTIARASDRYLIYSLHENITAQREIEKEKNEAVEQLKVIMNNMSGGVSAAVLDGHSSKYLFANNQFYSMIGYTPEQFKEECPEGLYTLIHPEDAERVFSIVATNEDGEGTADIEYRLIRRDGSVIWTRARGSICYLDGVDKPVHIAVHADITAEKEAQKEMKAKNAQLNAIMSSVNCGIAANAFLPDGSTECVFANEMFYSLIGYSKAEFEECVETLFSVVHEDDVYELRALVGKTLATGKSFTHRYRCHTKCGRTIFVRGNFSFMHLDDVEHPIILCSVTDITEIVLAEQKLQDTDIKIRALNDNLQRVMNDMPGGFVRLRIKPDKTFATEFANAAFCKIRGMTFEEILAADGEDAMSTIHPDDLPLVRELLEQIIDGNGKTSNTKYRLLRSDGEYIPLNVFGRFTKDEDGNTYVNVYYADVTDDEKKDLFLRDAMPFILSAIMESASDLSFVKNCDLEYLCCSDAFAKMAGKSSAAEVVGKTDYDLFDAETAEKYRSDDMKLFEGGKSLIDYLEHIPSDDGMQHLSSTSKYILRDTTGRIIGLYGVGRDVTETHTAFEQLKLLTDNMPGGLITYRLSAEGVRISYFNDGMCNMLGCTREEYLQATREGVITSVFEEDVPILEEKIHEIMTTHKPISCTYRLHNMNDDGYKWVSLRVAAPELQNGVLFANAVIYDVTEQKLAEEAVRIHEEELDYALSRMGRIIAEYDVATRTLRLPETYALTYGLERVNANVPYCFETTGRMTAEMYKVYRELYESILRGEKTGSAEVQKIDGDSNTHWEHMEFVTIFDNDGKPVKALIAADDTSEAHRQFELEQNRPTLAEGNLLAHAMFNITTGETLEYNYSDGTEVPITDRTAFIYGKNTIDVYIVDDEDREEYRRLNDPQTLLERYKNGAEEGSFEYRRRTPDGEVIWVRNVLRLMKDPACDDVLLFEYFYNIEQEKLKELMLASIVSTGYDYVAQINGKTGSYFVIGGDNITEALPPQSGDDMDAVVHKNAATFVHHEDRELLIKNVTLAGIKENLRHNDSFRFTYRILRDDGAIIYKKITEYYLDREASIIVLAREDVTQIMREEAEKNAALSAALIAANQASFAKSSFLSRMSHELRTPMNAIIGLSALSASELNDPRAMENNISKIGISARYLLSLINDILEMSRIESGSMTLAKEPFDFEHFISDVNAIIYAQTSAKGLDYDVAVLSTTEPMYLGDATKLQEVLVNILGNAVKFTPEGGKVSLSIEQFTRVKDGAGMRFIITDTGVGIDESFLPNMFDAFSQEASDYTSTSTGTGLGLAITKNLVDMMNGHIQVKSIKGVGSVFTVDVQLGIPKESLDYMDMLASMKLESISALVVDDDVTVCQSTEKILKSMGMRAEWAASGAAAIHRVQEVHKIHEDFDTIFIDWKPDMNGIETTREIRKVVGPDVTIIIITAYDWHNIEEEARSAGVDMFMEKPIFQSSIVRAFERVFSVNREKLAPPEPEAPDLTGKRILLAEDHPLNIEVAKRLLEKVGAEVVVACNGLEALETFATAADGYFDAILMDIRMPEMDGLTATKNIRRLRKVGSKTVPIIAMTANAFDEDVELSLKSGMNAHLAKPIEPPIMYATLRRWIK